MLDQIKKILYQPLRPFPTTQPVHYQLKNNFFSKLMGWKPLSSIMYTQNLARKIFTNLNINERLIEVPWIYNQFNFKKKGRVLDVGCCESTLSISLASLGFQVVGIDTRSYELQHPNFTFLQEDICQTSLKEKTFDFIICLSTLEHIGLNSLYGQSPKSTSDKKTLQVCLRLLKPGGKLLLTIPCAKKYFQNNFTRIYTPQRISRLLRPYKIVSQRFFAPNITKTIWQEVSALRLPFPPNFGVTTIVATSFKK